DIDPLSLGADYWDQHRHENLTAQEVAIYHMVDTMKTIPTFRTYVDIVTTIATGYYTKGKIDIGPYFTTYSFNPVEGNRFRIRSDIDPLSLGADYWDQHRHENLTAQEVAIYHMVDTMKTIPTFRTYLDIVTTIATGYYTKGKIDIGPYFTTYSFNPVEGNRFRI